jgi:hypothetical protein
MNILMHVFDKVAGASKRFVTSDFSSLQEAREEFSSPNTQVVICREHNKAKRQSLSPVDVAPEDETYQERCDRLGYYPEA